MVDDVATLEMLQSGWQVQAKIATESDTRDVGLSCASLAWNVRWPAPISKKKKGHLPLCSLIEADTAASVEFQRVLRWDCFHVAGDSSKQHR